MIDSFFSHIQSAREHWLFWPFSLLFVQIILYNFLFSQNGYLVYLEKSKEKATLQSQIDGLMKRKEELSKKLAHVKNEDEAIRDFITRLYRYDENSLIVKFIDEKKVAKEVNKDKTNMVVVQQLYILLSTVVLIVLTFFFWKLHRDREVNAA